MDIYELLGRVAESGIGQWVQYDPYAVRLIEAAHMIGVALVFGTIFIVDMRLVGLRFRGLSFAELSQDTLKWTWLGFAIAVITGLLMFVGQPVKYFDNPFFRIKMLVLLLAGINMLVFEFVTVRTSANWDTARRPPRAAIIAGVSSLVLWTAVIFLGRWIGYWIAPAQQVEIDESQGGGAFDLFGGGGF